MEERQVSVPLPEFFGVTLRSYFAAAALTGIRASEHGSEFSRELAAQLAWSDADAMIAYLAKGAA